MTQNQAAYATLVAPDSGVVTAVNVEAGQVVTAGQTVMKLAREEERSARDDLRESAEADAVEEDDGEESVDEMLELDQTELDELGLTLDDPHQPDDE